MKRCLLACSIVFSVCGAGLAWAQGTGEPIPMSPVTKIRFPNPPLAWTEDKAGREKHLDAAASALQRNCSVPEYYIWKTGSAAESGDILKATDAAFTGRGWYRQSAKDLGPGENAWLGVKDSVEIILDWQKLDGALALAMCEADPFD